MKSKATIIFIHGIGLSAEVWAPQIAWCKKNKINYLALTLPGHGNRRNADISVDNMIDEIVNAAQKYPNVILVGHSFGGWLVVQVSRKLKNINSIIFINPLISYKQLNFLFMPTLRIVKFFQSIFGVEKNGNFSKGSKIFWRWGIYPYCLIHNDAGKLIDIFCQIKKREKESFSRRIINAKIIISKKDELLARWAFRAEVILASQSGHMLFRLDPEAVNDLLRQSV